jgi:hypothetical protein
MPETATWRILGTSLQKTSSDDRSDPTVASARSRSSSQDWSSCSSSRMKTGSEASRVRNRSNGRRASGLRRTAMRLPPGWTDRASAPTSSEALGADASAIPTLAATGRSPTGTAATSAVAGASMAGTTGGLGTTSASAASPTTMAASVEEPASGARSSETGDAQAPCGEIPRERVGRTTRPGAALAAQSGAVLRAFRGARSVWPWLRLLDIKKRGREKENHDQDIWMGSQDEDIPRYPPTPGHYPPRLGGGFLDPGSRRRGPPRWQLRRHPCFGRPGSRLPGHSRDDMRVTPMRCRYERRPLGSRRPDLALRSHLSSSGRGVR